MSNKNLANALRFLSIDAVETSNSGHPGMPMGMADFTSVLFNEFLKFNPQDANWHDRDRFILSAGHGSMLLYSALFLSGYPDICLDDLKNSANCTQNVLATPNMVKLVELKPPPAHLVKASPMQLAWHFLKKF